MCACQRKTRFTVSSNICGYYDCWSVKTLIVHEVISPIRKEKWVKLHHPPPPHPVYIDNRTTTLSTTVPERKKTITPTSFFCNEFAGMLTKKKERKKKNTVVANTIVSVDTKGLKELYYKMIHSCTVRVLVFCVCFMFCFPLLDTY